jgi:murein DD-endopeptidase MepM/ murein hydrolase activator NlpD
MNRYVLLALVGALIAFPAFAQAPKSGGGVVRGPTDHNTEIDRLHRRAVARARALGLETGAAPEAIAPAAARPNLEFPLRLRPAAKAFRGNGITNFVDLNTSSGVLDYACNARTYDGHNGTDFALFPYQWIMMDAPEVEIVAAAPGVIIDKADGNFDRQCTSNGNPANYVVVRQDNGLYAYYFHMKSGSVTPLAINARVAEGDYLGLVGSSGNSTGPHLHFELRTAQSFGGSTIDPFVGACNAVVAQWKHQPEDFDTDVVRLATHSSPPPSQSNNCTDPNPPGYSDQFAVGATVYGAVFLRDERQDTPVKIAFINPSGTEVSSFTTTPGAGVRPLVFWWTSTVANTAGQWKLRATLEGKDYEHAFVVGTVPAATTVQALIQPQARSPRGTSAVVFGASVRNTGSTTATGCSLAPDMPLAMTWNTQTLAGGDLNRTFDVPPGATQNVRLTLRGKPGYSARGIKIPIRVFCLNASAPGPTKGYNLVTLSFQRGRTPDIIATPKNTVVHVTNSTATFGVTANNQGGDGTVTVTATRSRPLPLTVKICETNASNQCLSPPTASVTRTFVAGETSTWKVTLTRNRSIALDEVNNRIIVEYANGGIVRGATSVAVTTSAADVAQIP